MFEAAWRLLPEPAEEWNAALWILAAIADCHFLQGDFGSAHRVLVDAIRRAGGLANAFIHLRLGESELELGNEARAADELIRAYALAGLQAFEGEDPKYLAFLATRAELFDD